MIRPTGRAVVAFVCGIPLALIVAIYNPSLWVVSFAYGAIVLLAALTDVSLAFPPRLLDLKITVPDHISIGDRGAVTATIAPTRWRRATTFELIADQRGEIEPSTIVAVTAPRSPIETWSGTATLRSSNRAGKASETSVSPASRTMAP